LWDLEGNLLADFNKHKGSVNSAEFSPDGTRILTASEDGTAKIWYTPEAIYEWLKTAPIPPLTDKEKKELGIK
jgi:WD40 repeat protein